MALTLMLLKILMVMLNLEAHL
jgi:hypothetical protein